MAHEEKVRAAADAISNAHGLLVTAGAGMGVDSGLPDFRGPEGFWSAYPPFRALGLCFEDLANPAWFRSDPSLAWGFYGHRLNLYRSTEPHAGFRLLHAWGERLPSGAFVFTSNVDGHFQRAGFADERVAECHGSIGFLQCLADCGAGIFPAVGVEVAVDPATFRASPPFPSCPRCGSLARPNILMFGDGGWESGRSDAQERRLAAWLDELRGPLAVVECGAGTAIPTVRRFGERVVFGMGGLLVRINAREASLGPAERSFDVSLGKRGRGIGLPMGSLDALRAIDGELNRLS